MNINLNTISDDDVRGHLFELRNGRMVHTSNPGLWAQTRIVTSFPKEVEQLMEAAATDRVGTDFWGTLHPLRPSAEYRAGALRKEEELALAQLEAARARRQLAENEAASRVNALRQRQAEEELRRRQAEATAAAVRALGRGLGRLFR